MGSDDALPGGGADPPGPGRRLLHRRDRGDQRGVRGVRRRHRLRHRGRA